MFAIARVRFDISWFLSIYLTIAGGKNMVRYTEDFAVQFVKLTFHCISD